MSERYLAASSEPAAHSLLCSMLNVIPRCARSSSPTCTRVPRLPARGRFVHDQVQALQRLPGHRAGALRVRAGERWRRTAAPLPTRTGACRGTRFDVVHAHFGLTAWPALAVRATSARGDAARNRPRASPLPRADARRAAVARSRRGRLRCARRPDPGLGAPRAHARCAAVRRGHSPLPADRSRAGASRARARSRRPLSPVPRRPRARREALRPRAGGSPARCRCWCCGGVDPELAPLYVNAANAVLVTSEREGFGLAVLEALACEVPVLATPCGIAPEALADVREPTAGRSSWSAGARPWRSIWRPGIRGSPAAPQRSATRPTRWPPAWPTHGAALLSRSSAQVLAQMKPLPSVGQNSESRSRACRASALGCGGRPIRS